MNCKQGKNLEVSASIVKNYDSRYSISDRKEEQRRSNDVSAERRNQVSRREQSQDDYNRGSLIKNDALRRKDVKERTEDLQYGKTLEKERSKSMI